MRSLEGLPFGVLQMACLVEALTFSCSEQGAPEGESLGEDETRSEELHS